MVRVLTKGSRGRGDDRRLDVIETFESVYRPRALVASTMRSCTTCRCFIGGPFVSWGTQQMPKMLFKMLSSPHTKTSRNSEESILNSIFGICLVPQETKCPRS